MKPIQELFELACRCNKCGCWQRVKITDIIEGKGRCRMGVFNTPPCDGPLLYWTNDERMAMGNATALLGYLNWTLFREKTDSPLAEIVDTVFEDLNEHLDATQSPRDMGWVDANGNP